MWGRTVHTQSKVVVPDANFPWWLSPTKKKKKKKRYKLILSRAIDDKQILQPDWLRGGVGHTRPKKIVSYATFPWWRIPCKNFKISIDSFQRSWWSLNTTTIRLVESIYPLDTGCKLNKNKMFWRCPRYPLNILCTFHLLLGLGGRP